METDRQLTYLKMKLIQEIFHALRVGPEEIESW